MVATTGNTPALLPPEAVAELFTKPVLAESVAGQVATVVTIGTTKYRVPRVSADPSAGWVNEGAEIPVSDMTTDEIEVTPTKLAGLSIITRELADDSSPEAAEQVGLGLARDTARKLDAAFAGNLPAPAAKGLASLPTTGAGSVTTVGAGAAGSPWTNVDLFVAAVYAALARNATVGSFLANPADALALAQLKQGTGSNVPLLQPDPTAPTRSTINGVPLLTMGDVPVGTIWAVPRDRAVIVVRNDVEITTDRSVYFTSDRVAVRSTMRLGFAFPQPAAIVRIFKG